jgi:hypothetical protein
MKNKTIVTGIIALIVGIGIGYGGAMALSPASSATSTHGTYAARMGGGMHTAGGGFLSGTVATVSSESITLNTQDGSSHVVLVTPSTNISKSVSGSLSDVSAGTNVIVSGTTNSDGSLSATLIQLRPAGTPQTTPMNPTAQ